MLDPKPSSLPLQEREKYVLETAKRLCEQWNFFSPQEFNRERIEDYIKERDLYLGIKSDIIWATSPSSLWSSLKPSLRSSLKPSLRSSLISSFWLSLRIRSSGGASLGLSLCSSLYSSLCSSLGSSLSSSLESLLESSLGSSLFSSLEPSLRPPLGSSLSSSLFSSLESLIYSSLGSSLKPSLRSSLISSFWSSLWSSHRFLLWDIYYQFNEDKKIKNFVKYLPEAYKEGLGFAVILDNKFCALPMPEYHLNRQNQLHKDLSPAVIWANEEKEYWLNGVRCPKQIVMTRAEELNPDLLLKEKNAEVRREIIRKIGIEKVCQKLNAQVVDKYVCKKRFPVIKECYDERNNKWDVKIEGYCDRDVEYELLFLRLGDKRRRPYLKMLNPSIGIYQIEGVPPNIHTVKEALKWRDESDEEPEILT